MNKKLITAFFLLLLLAIVSMGLVFYYSEGIAVLSPKGLVGEKQRNLLWLSTLLMLIVVIPVFLLTVGITWKYRAEKKSEYLPNWDYNFVAEALWWGIPLLIVAILGGVTYRACHDLDPFKPLQSDTKPIHIQVVALQWKWLFIYPEQKIATVNYVQFPENTPVNFELTGDAPMNSFWIPELGGQIYAMSGMKSKLHLIANGSGTYRGSSAHISGTGFAGMVFQAQSTSPSDFERWIDQVRSESKPLTQEEYVSLTAPSEYNPIASYRLDEPDLFDRIVMKYMMPQP